MQNRRRTLGTITLLSAALIGVCAGSQPASARRAIPDVTGSYFGRFQDRNGTLLQSDLNITLQVRQRIGGRLSVGAVLHGMAFQGVVTPSGRVTLVGRGGSGGNNTQLKLQGTYNPSDEDMPASIVGRFIATGTVRGQGTFILRGGRIGR